MSEAPPPSKKKRFKGVENFLRRVAFNLGNTPSQTEVKIISCIPIDVTELQQKIILLERQLECAQTKLNSDKQAFAVTVDNHVPKMLRTHNDGANIKERGDRKRNKKGIKDTEVNFLLQQPIISKSSLTLSKSRLEKDKSTSSEIFSQKDKKSVVSFLFPSFPEKEIVEEDIKWKEGRRSIFTKQKPKDNVNLVYYANTPTLPFSNLNLESTASKNNKMKKSYLEDVVRKSYRAEFLDVYSDTSNFSSPVCRDVETRLSPFDSDVCSCCHGKFQNVDHYMGNPINLLNGVRTYATYDMRNRDTYYDSNLYDVIPVQDKPIKNKKEPLRPKTKPKDPLNIMLNPDFKRTKMKSSYLKNNYQQHSRTGRMKEVSRKKKNFQNKFEKEYTPTTFRIYQGDDHNNDLIDCGITYMKPKEVQKRQATNTITVKHVECLTSHNFISTDCQTQQNIESELVPPPPSPTPAPQEDSPEITLNKIKNILESVLSAVKTNSNLKPPRENTATKDATVQKESSQNNIQQYASNLLGSFTYSPYNMNVNPYMASCSRQGPPPEFARPTMQYPKCLQNFPLIVQTPPPHLCTNCYRYPTRIDAKLATSACTNTDRTDGVNETKALIKEIYKSIAVDVEMLTKDKGDDTPRSDTKEKVHNYKNTTQESEKDKKNAVMSVYRNNDYDDQDTPQSGSRELASQRVSQDISNSITEEEPVQSSEDIAAASKSTLVGEATSDVSDTNDTDTESEESQKMTKPIKPHKDKSKTGIFSKMAQIFSKKKSRQEKHISEEDEPSDSDDYETIYSQKIEKPTRRHDYIHATSHKRTHIKERHPRYYVRAHESPYMDQEYRRQWNKNLMFQEKPRYSSEKPFATYYPKGAYRRDYEARSVILTPNFAHRHHRYDYMPDITEQLEQEKLREIEELKQLEQLKKQQQLELNEKPKKVTVSTSGPKLKVKPAACKGIKWIKKHNLGRYGEQMKKFILES